jgi:thiol-disulfide isomerase/thioredoxin
MVTRRAALASLLSPFAPSLLRASTLPRPAPELAIHLPGGKQVLVSEAKGKVVALAFILTYCPHCQKTVRLLSALQNEYGPQGFQAYGSAIEDMASTALPDFLKRFSPSFPVGYNDRHVALEYLQHPPMLRLLMPQLAFVDRKGQIRAQYSGDDQFMAEAALERNLRKQIEALLAEPAPAVKKPSPAKKKKAVAKPEVR